MKIEQIAFFGTYRPINLHYMNRIFGMRQWTEDHATGMVCVYGSISPKPITARLAFNEEAGIQFELLDYDENTSWLDQRDGGRLSRPVLSHIGCHVDSVKEELAELPFELAQLMVTFQHTNPFLVESKRTYIYAVLDSQSELGFDLKLIQRVENAVLPTQGQARMTLEAILTELAI